MTPQDDDRDFEQWQQDWQAGPPRDITTEEQIRHYVKRRSGLMWSFVVIDFIIGGIALPVLTYMGVTATSDVERWTMFSLAYLTVAVICFGWWNWRGVLRSAAATTAEYLAISAERLRRMRIAWRIAWVVLAAEFVVFVIWIWDQLYSGQREHDAGDAVFAWGWLVLFFAAFAVWLVWFGRWIDRDTTRFEKLRRELE